MVNDDDDDVFNEDDDVFGDKILIMTMMMMKTLMIKITQTSVCAFTLPSGFQKSSPSLSSS